MFDKFTENLRRVIFLARYECTQLGARAIDTEHLLLGLLREKDTLILHFFPDPASIDYIRKKIEERATVGEKTPSTIEILLTNETKLVFAFAVEESENLSHRHVGTEHLLLGLLRTKESLAEKILRENRITLSSIYRELGTTTYQSQFVAFVDILGFSNLVQKTQKDKIVLKQLIDALSIVNDNGSRYEEMNKAMIEMLKYTGKDVNERKDEYKRISKTWGVVFSDSIVLAAENSIDGLYNLLGNLSVLSLRLLESEIFVRGGIVLGPIYREGSIMFGPALIDAYELEHNLAIYPRILIADEIIKYIRTFNPTDNFMVERCQSIIRQDFDGLSHLDILSRDAMHWALRTFESPSIEYDMVSMCKELELIRSVLEKNLSVQTNENLKIHVKLRWFAQYFNSAISKENEMGLKHIDV